MMLIGIKRILGSHRRISRVGGEEQSVAEQISLLLQRGGRRRRTDAASQSQRSVVHLLQLRSIVDAAVLFSL